MFCQKNFMLYRNQYVDQHPYLYINILNLLGDKTCGYFEVEIKLGGFYD